MINQYEVSSHNSEEPIEGASGAVTLKTPYLPNQINSSVQKRESKKRFSVDFDNLASQEQHIKYPDFKINVQQQEIITTSGGDNTPIQTKRSINYLNNTTPNFQTIDEEHLEYQIPSDKKKVLFSKDSNKSSIDELEGEINASDQQKRYLEDEETSGYIHSEVLIPLALKSNNFLETDRVVLYREDCREIPYVNIRDENGGSVSPRLGDGTQESAETAVQGLRTPVTAHFVIEISKSKNRIYILAIKIPEKFINAVVSGRKSVDLIGTHY